MIVRADSGSKHTASRGGMVLDSSSLAVELVVDSPRWDLGIGVVEAALKSRASRSGTLREAKNTALREHCCWIESEWPAAVLKLQGWEYQTTSGSGGQTEAA